MDPTWAAAAAGACGVLVGGGAALAWSAARRRARRPRPEERGLHPAPGVAVLPDDPVASRLPEDARAVLSVLPGGSAVVDTLGRVVWATPSAQAWGLVRVGKLGSEPLLDAVREVRRTGIPRSLEAELRRRRGTRPASLLVRVAPLDDDLVLVLAEDRSEARRVDDVRRDFVANVSHELKTPVGALSLLAEAAEDAADDPEAVRRFAARMQHEATRLSQLVNELIDLSRLQGDDPMAHAQVVRAGDVVADAVDRIRLTASARDIRVRVVGDLDRTVLGDREQLTKAVRNLLDNAVSYSPDRTRVVVEVHQIGATVEISVTDQGIGIPEAELQRIFERFYRVDPARSRATGGTGLGLSIVKHVCANHGGEVAVWSVAGSGSTFTLRLPAHAPAQAQPESEHASDVPLRKVVP